MGSWQHYWEGYRFRLRNVSRRHSVRSILPSNPRADDLYLVEFPKSGITWLGFLITNTNFLLSGQSERSVTFFNINDFVPDIHINRHLGPPPLSIPGYRIIKSHAEFTPDYAKVIYLVRDPRHVMLSYYSFLIGLGGFQGTIEQMLEHPIYGIDAWRRHVSNWLDRIPAYHLFTLLRYEDFVADTAAELKRLYHMMGYHLSEEVVAKAIERSSLQRMREEEVLFNRGHPALSRLAFVRQNENATAARGILSDAARARIEEVAKPLLVRLGY